MELYYLGLGFFLMLLWFVDCSVSSAAGVGLPWTRATVGPGNSLMQSEGVIVITLYLFYFGWGNMHKKAMRALPVN